MTSSKEIKTLTISSKDIKTLIICSKDIKTLIIGSKKNKFASILAITLKIIGQLVQKR